MALQQVAKRFFRTSVGSINPKLLNAQYAVRGEIVLKALEYQKKLHTKNHGLPFNEIIFCNIGNPQELGQKPISFFRQVLNACNDPQTMHIYPEDVQARARLYLHHIGSTGAYSNSQGIHVVREEVAKFIQQRDGAPSHADQIFLTDGASAGVHMWLTALLRSTNDAIMAPVPQYPLYSAAVALHGGTLLPYNLDESTNWHFKADELYRSLKAAKQSNPDLNVRALVVINPGNPTGQVLDAHEMKDVIAFCNEQKLILMADEVYQTNIYNSQRPFISFKKLVAQMGLTDLELVSFHSVSKGFVGECGRRGGYFELHNIDPEVKMQLYKLASINLCSNVEGQVMVGLMTNPPVPGQPSFAQYAQERDAISQSLQRRAHKLASALVKAKGIHCPQVEGAMYLFPRVELPEKAVAAARAAGKQPDLFYCLECLAHTGIVVVPGSGFGQPPNTWHFRTTFLPPEDKIDIVAEKFRQFNDAFMAKYA
eukprot:TRINITY_DN4706_c0_g1_i1.p1 TRINITY_DN4706_c0_g1~~TRINITY_DN4706_c0_g1_i1.p1  ORF type:complete len:482 (+),score=171.06 TRINITY_DN4706_c0_g1_i1:57-1502(+)